MSRLFRFSYKFNHGALKCEVSVLKQDASPPGHWPDLLIALCGVCQVLDEELILTDFTYAGAHCYSEKETKKNQNFATGSPCKC